MARIFWDTNVFIHYLEDAGPEGKAARELMRRMRKRGDHLITSWMTIAEIQVQPALVGQTQLAEELRDAILQDAEIVPFDRRASEAYVRVRVKTRIKGPDAVQLATAAAHNVDLFVTNDKQLLGVTVPGIHFLATIDRVPI